MISIRKIFHKPITPVIRQPIAPVKVQEKSLNLQESLAKIDKTINELTTARAKMMEYYSFTNLLSKIMD